MSPYSSKNDPTISVDDPPVLIQCAFDGGMYDEKDMYYDSLAEVWILKMNLVEYAKRELPIHEQESYIQIIKKENEKR